MVRLLLMSLAVMPISSSYGWVQSSPGISSTTRIQQQQRLLTTQLQVSFSPGALGEEYHHHYESQEEAKKLMDRANACAHSETCSVEDAMKYLQDVIHIQSDCVTGTLVGKDLCENQDVVADTVANLRQKIGSSVEQVVDFASISEQNRQRYDQKNSWIFGHSYVSPSCLAGVSNHNVRPSLINLFSTEHWIKAHEVLALLF